MADGFLRRIKIEATILLPVTGQNRYSETQWSLDTNTKNLRVDFRLREFSAHPFPQGELKIFNLSTNSRSLLTRAVRVKIGAGHRETTPLPTLFAGQVFWGETKHADVNVVSTFLLGGRLEFDQHVEVSEETPQPLFDVCKDLVDQAADQVNVRTFGVIESNLRLAEFEFEFRDTGGDTRSETVVESILTPENLSLSGQFAEVFTTLLSKFDLVWHCDETGTIHVQRGVLPAGTPQFTLNRSNGMIGTPTVNRDGITVQSLLDSRIKLRTLLRVESDRAETPGLFTPSEIEHKGSNWGNEWFTTIQAVR